ncbi:hypothetical protein LXA47_08575 [Massilia sp. P8910]|uniref:hypothetical protein n=1 Tax=Massilia antarctica TaxID=2765360 RepID=UPI001E5AC510|nr:hypothetical protein [Massilia antarctica]MCE3603660.1 hypothetical protein [Massilia antarctica]
MPLAPATRVNYFDRQFIRLAELRDEQAYHLQQRRRHNLSHHSWGIVAGLELLHEDGHPVVRPGLAVDGYGRELLLLNRAVFGREQFERLGTRRLDLWLEYRLDFGDDRLAPAECGSADPNRHYRAIERAEIVVTRDGARPDPRHPPGVPVTAFEDPLLATPDDPLNRWPVYLGRIVMDIPATGEATFEIDTADRIYVGLNAELIDHPGSAGRIELGRRPIAEDVKRVGDDEHRYAPGAKRDFAVFAPGPGTGALEPTLAVYGSATQIRGNTEVHGNLVLDGASLQFPDAGSGAAAPSEDVPSIYRSGDALRLDMGTLEGGGRKLVIGVTKDGAFIEALEVRFSSAEGALTPKATVIVHGDLHVDGTIDSADVRTRTVTEEVAALLTGMVQTTIAAGSN